MPFWKPSDDPWDRKPDKCPAQPKGPQANPLDSLKAWNEQRKANAKEKEEAKRLPPEPCPWCGKDMEQGFLLTGRDPIRWYPGVYKIAWLVRDEIGSFRVDTEEDFGHYKTAWLCRECGKIIFDIPESERVYDFPGSQEEETLETMQEEETSEE